MTFWTGAAVGAAAMYFLDPQHGSQRRATALDTYERLRPTVAAHDRPTRVAVCFQDATCLDTPFHSWNPDGCSAARARS